MPSSISTGTGDLWRVYNNGRPQRPTQAGIPQWAGAMSRPLVGKKWQVLHSIEPCNRTAGILAYRMLTYLGLSLRSSKVKGDELPHDVLQD